LITQPTTLDIDLCILRLHLESKAISSLNLTAF
jgi:hypothetical protein